MTKGDRWLFWLLIGVGLFLLAWQAWPAPSSERQVQVFRDGELLFSFPLTETEIRTEQVQVAGGVATIEVRDGAVRLAPTEDYFCPERICIRTGWIKQPGEAIICVPNKLVIRIEEREDGVDAVI
ncbi:NusG domain II-containing protein [Capillibacterium thermochitinicola]|uniref:NusG domain II-containing protein n=1 Tax=Capillibacterium thermochitinicola TaxID=2699427 RepID=A0A8J6HSM6_9FIRM|nr:NusG domain II-containing protein [Capillibacterium thermochitinicola]MBA2133416.1 NusG domain II-containing protein [Capillibacterium thermochitinicola]